MNPIAFKEHNVVFAIGQPEYLPLPAYRDEDGQVITCWKMSWRERAVAFLTGRIWLSTLTFNERLQPQHVGVESPFVRDGKFMIWLATLNARLLQRK